MCEDRSQLCNSALHSAHGAHSQSVQPPQYQVSPQPQHTSSYVLPNVPNVEHFGSWQAGYSCAAQCEMFHKTACRVLAVAGHRQQHNRAAVMMVARSAQSSRSMNECDDRAERIILMRDCMWERAMPVKLSPAARQLAGERGAPAQVPALRQHVSTGAAGYEPCVAWQCKGNCSPGIDVNGMGALPYRVVMPEPSVARWPVRCNEF